MLFFLHWSHYLMGNANSHLNIRTVVFIFFQCQLSHIPKDGLLHLATNRVIWSCYWLYVSQKWSNLIHSIRIVTYVFHISRVTLQVFLRYWTRYEISLGKPNSRSSETKWRAHNVDVSGTTRKPLRLLYSKHIYITETFSYISILSCE